MNNIRNPLAYIAGLIDAEGCLRLMKKKRKNSFSTKYAPSISIVVTDKVLLDFVVSVFPTKIWHYKSKKKNRLDTYVIRYMSLKTKEILQKIYPYLRIKRDQAEILMKVIQIKNGLNGKSYSMEEIYEPFYQKITQMKYKNAISGHYEIMPIVKAFENINDEYSYIAGLSDGDGSIHYSEGNFRRKDRGNKIYIKRTKKMSFMMNNPEGIIPLSEICSTNIHRFKKTFTLQIQGKALKIILEKLLPFLILKREDAQKILNL